MKHKDPKRKPRMKHHKTTTWSATIQQTTQSADRHLRHLLRRGDDKHNSWNILYKHTEWNTWRLLLSVSQSTRVWHLRAGGNMMRVDDITWTARAAAATVAAVRCHRTITTQQRIHGATSHRTVTWNGMIDSRRSSRMWRLTHRSHFEAVYIQVVAHLATYFHREMQQVCRAEYLHTYQSVCETLKETVA